MTAQVALITGASSGIGRAAALTFVKHDLHVAGVARRGDRLAELRAEVEALPAPHGEFLPIEGDVTQAGSMQAAVQQTMERFGRLDVLIANAGVGYRGAVVEARWDDLDTLLRTNIDGVLHSIRAAVPAMRQTGGGHIILISSVTYNLVSPYAAPYAASKAFVTSLAHSLRMELEDDHIAVTSFHIGRTQTEFNEKRLGLGKRPGEGLPTMSAKRVAQALLHTVEHPRRTVVLRLLDRLTIWGNILLPDVLGRIARRQYR